MKRALGVILLVSLLTFIEARPSLADGVALPVELQAELLAKLAGYDRNFRARAGSQARVLLLVKPNNARSSTAAAAMKSALSKLDQIGGLPHQASSLTYEGAASLAKRCRAERVAVVYVTPGFEAELDALSNSLSGVDVLSVSAVPEFVPKGIVIGFELVSGKPKILLNLEQAKRQNVNFKADVLKLMRVYR
jgi:hypothetical protein